MGQITEKTKQRGSSFLLSTGLFITVFVVLILGGKEFSKGHQLKSQQAEAKLALASVYMAEFGSFKEHKTYASCLRTLIETEKNLRYAYGFTQKNIDSDKKIGPPCVNGAHQIDSDRWNKKFSELFRELKEKVPNIEATVSPDGQHFTVLAIGQLESQGKIYLDAWTIDENKKVKNVYNSWRIF
ncbi:MAG: hypothetical protein WCG27_01240 [Pseudomonadota bacterium]